MKEAFLEFVTTFTVTLVAAAVVTFLWSLIVHGAGEFDWATAFRLAIILGVVLSWLKIRERKKGH